MNPFPSVGATVGYLQNAIAPSSLPSVLPRRSLVMARAEYQLGREWHTDAAKIGIAVGVGIAAFAFFGVKAIQGKGKK